MITIYKIYSVSRFPVNEDGTFEERGAYEFDEIGERHSDALFTFGEYLALEKETVSVFSLMCRMKNAGPTFFLSDLRRNFFGDTRKRELTTERQRTLYENLTEGYEVSLVEVEEWFPLLIREDVEAILYSRRTHFVVFIDGNRAIRVICEELGKDEIREIKELGFFVYETPNPVL